MCNKIFISKKSLTALTKTSNKKVLGALYRMLQVVVVGEVRIIAETLIKSCAIDTVRGFLGVKFVSLVSNINL